MMLRLALYTVPVKLLCCSGGYLSLTTRLAALDMRLPLSGALYTSSPLSDKLLLSVYRDKCGF